MTEYTRIKELDCKIGIICHHCKAESDQFVKLGVEIKEESFGSVELMFSSEVLECPFCKENFTAKGHTGKITPKLIEGENIKIEAEKS